MCCALTSKLLQRGHASLALPLLALGLAAGACSRTVTIYSEPDTSLVDVCMGGRARALRLIQLLLQIGHVRLILGPVVGHRRVCVARSTALPARHELGLQSRLHMRGWGWAGAVRHQAQGLPFVPAIALACIPGIACNEFLALLSAATSPNPCPTRVIHPMTRASVQARISAYN